MEVEAKVERREASFEPADLRLRQRLKIHGQGSHNYFPMVAKILQYAASGLTLDIFFKQRSAIVSDKGQNGSSHYDTTKGL